MPTIRYDDGSTRVTTIREATRIAGDILQELCNAAISPSVDVIAVMNTDNDPEVDIDFVKAALADKYADEHRVASGAGRLWYAMGKVKGSKQLLTLSAYEVLSMKKKIIEGDVSGVGTVIKSDYMLLYAAIRYKLTHG